MIKELQPVLRRVSIIWYRLVPEFWDILFLPFEQYKESAFLLPSGRLFQSVITGGKKELKYNVVLEAAMVCISFAFLKLYRENLLIKGGTRDEG